VSTLTTFATAVLILLLGSRAEAQTSATLVTRVLDATGATLASVQITVTHGETGLVRRAVTDEYGRATVTALPVGPYELRADRAGFRPLTQPGVRLTVGAQVVVTLVMQVGLSDEVTVVAGTSSVNVRSGELSFLVDDRTMARIPANGRNFTDLMSLLPAVTPFPHRDNGSVVAHGLAMSVNGQDPRANVYLLDGTLLNDFTNGPAGSAAGTALGMDTVREFRVESNAYSAEFGRNVGGQINAITKSGTNRLSGSAFEYFRHDALDARNYFDGAATPAFRRDQLGGTIGGPVARDRLFFFGGYEALHETLGRTVVTTVPDDNARLGHLPTGSVTIDPAVLPFLNEFPRANGASLGGGLAQFSFPFDQRLTEHFAQGRLDAVFDGGAQFFVRYTIDDTEQRLPMDYPQFPRAFVSRNQFVTAEHRQASSDRMLHTARFGYSRTRIGQNVEVNTSQALPVFVPGRAVMGAIDIGGFPRFGPQTSADVRLRQDVVTGQYDLSLLRGRHLVRIGTLFEHYRDDETNPTFSLGIFRFANLSTFLRNLPAQFIGLTPAGDINRHWDWTLYGVYLQDDWQIVRDVTVNAGVRMEGTTMPVDRGGRDVSLRDLLAAAPTPGPLYINPGPTSSPRLGVSWNVGGRGRTAVRAGYGLYYNTTNHQNLVVTVTNPPATPRVILANPTFPVPSFSVATGVSVRPVQFDVDLPRVQMWNVNVQQAFWRDWSVTIGFAGARGEHLWRNSDRNIPAPAVLPDGTLFYAAGLTRPNPNFSAIELKSSDGDSWYKALVVDVQRRWSRGLQVQSSYTWSKAEDTTQNSTFFSDSTTATTSAMPEFIPGYNKGLSDFHAAHNLVLTLVWDVPRMATASGPTRALVNGWQLSGIVRARSGSPLTPMLQTNRSRSLWSPSLGPGTGPDRPSYAPGRGPDSAVTGNPAQWFDPSAFVLPQAGTFGNVGRNELIGPDLRIVDLAIGRTFAPSGIGAGRTIDVRVEIFNLFNRTNFGPPSLIAFAGTSDDESPLASFGQIRTTVTSARQVQLGVRFGF
jgi:hypothetical protein